jgi:1,2-diacylglycerol 3-alpha-glucosyltransferase
VNILMMTNTYLPHVGGVARSIDRFVKRYQNLGHHVMIVAPEFNDMPENESHVIRTPSIRNFNHTDFSVVLPVPHRLSAAVKEFEPDIVHSHHPFLLGGTALRIAHTFNIPLVFTHHTRYEDYTHYMPGNSAWMKRFVERLATHYANLCDQVFVPSQSIQTLIEQRGVTTPISVVPTGVEVDEFSQGDGAGFRQSFGIPPNSIVVGHLGRLSEEKNLPFLVTAIIRFMLRNDTLGDTRCLLVGAGPLLEKMEKRFAEAELSHRLHVVGELTTPQLLVNAYHAMDVFTFASKSETQGMVITEAMAAGLPVVALDAPGVREVVDDNCNGHLLLEEDVESFSTALHEITSANSVEYGRFSQCATATAKRFSMEQTANTALELYSRLHLSDATHRPIEYPFWVDAVHTLQSELELFKSATGALTESIRHE